MRAFKSKQESSSVCPHHFHIFACEYTEPGQSSRSVKASGPTLDFIRNPAGSLKAYYELFRQGRSRRTKKALKGIQAAPIAEVQPGTIRKKRLSRLCRLQPRVFLFNVAAQTQSREAFMFLPHKLYGVIGDPVAHSLSPLLHNTAFQTWGIPSVLMAWHILPERLKDFVQAVRTLPIAGCCVTIPHKIAIVPLLDRITPLAASVGAVNTLYWDGPELVGHNTDVEGFLFPLWQYSALSRVLVLGAGGAARAVLGGLYQLPGVREILICARREEQARELIATVRPMEDEHKTHQKALPDIRVLPWDSRHDCPADLIVNTTPAGLDGKSPLEHFPRPDRQTALAYDLVYFRTPFLDAAAAAGWTAINGRDMFLAQAGAQFTLWTGFPMPEAASAALDEAIARHNPL